MSGFSQAAELSGVIRRPCHDKAASLSRAGSLK